MKKVDDLLKKLKMDRISKKKLGLVTVGVTSVVVGGLWIGNRSSEVQADGWAVNDSGKSVYYQDKTLMIGWQVIDGNRFYFNEDGTSAIGWQEIDGKKYYFDIKGIMVTGLYDIDGDVYLFNEDGTPFNGAKMIGQNEYTFIDGMIQLEQGQTATLKNSETLEKILEISSADTVISETVQENLLQDTNNNPAKDGNSQESDDTPTSDIEGTDSNNENSNENSGDSSPMQENTQNPTETTVVTPIPTPTPDPDPEPVIPENSGSSDNKVEEVTYAYADLNVPYINQYSAGAPMGCEAASLLEALHYKGCATNYDLATFLKEMPVASDGNPHHGFSNTPWEVLSDDYYQSIFPEPLASWGKNYGNVSNISGSSIETIRAELLAGNPIVVYVTYQFGYAQWQNWWFGNAINNMHVMTVCGYDEKNAQYKVADPAGGIYWVSSSNFERCYNYLKWAVVVR